MRMTAKQRADSFDWSSYVVIAITMATLSSCCILTKSAASSRFSQLESEHIAFIDAYVSGPSVDAEKIVAQDFVLRQGEAAQEQAGQLTVHILELVAEKFVPLLIAAAL